MLYNKDNAREITFRDTNRLNLVIRNRQNSLVGNSTLTDYDNLLMAIQIEANICKKLQNNLDFSSLNSSEQYYFNSMLNFISGPYKYMYAASFSMFNIINKKKQCKNLSNDKLRLILDARKQFDTYYSNKIKQLNTVSGNHVYLDSSLTRFLILYMDRFDDNTFKKIEPYFEYMLKFYLNNRKTKSSDSDGFEFICRYSYSMKQRNILKSFNKINDNNIGRNDCQLLYTSKNGENWYGEHCSRDNVIAINPKTIDNVIGLMKTTFHELIHYTQELRLRNNFLTDKSFEYVCFLLLGGKMGKDGLSEYNRNYRNQEIENEANETAYDEVIEYLSKIGITNEIKRNLILEIVKINIGEKLNLKREDTNFSFESSPIFKFRLLSDMLEKNPSLISKYDILSIYYDESGKIKDYISILKHPENSKNHSLMSNTSFQCMQYLTVIGKIDTRKLYQEKDKEAILVGVKNVIDELYDSIVNIYNVFRAQKPVKIVAKKRERIAIISKTLFKMEEITNVINIKNNFNTNYILNRVAAAEKMIKEVLGESPGMGRN